MRRTSSALALVVLLASSAQAAAPSPVPQFSKMKPGPHGGRMVHHHGRQVEVKQSPTEKMLHAYVSKKEGEPPKDVSVTLFHDGKPGPTVKLKAVEPTQDGFYHYQSAPGQDGAELSPAEGSAVGIGIQFGFE